MMRLLIAFLFCLSLATPAWAGSSRDFDGVSDTSDYANPSGLTVGTDSFTALIWVYWTQGADTADETIISQQDGTGTGRTWLSIDDDGASCGTGDEIYSFLGGACTDTATVMVQNTWTLLGVMSDEAAGAVNVFQDGVTIGSESKTVDAATGLIRVGARKTGTTEDFEGQLADFSLCEQATSITYINEARFIFEIAVAATCGTGVYYIYSPLYGLNSPEDDISGNGATGTLTGTTESFNGPPISAGGMMIL